MSSAALVATLGLGLSSPTSFADTATPTSTHTVTVFAASSLTKVYNALAAKFEAAFPEVTIKISYGSSTTLATQINAGAPVDIFASADVPDMTAVASEFPSPKNYLVNQVVIAVPKSSRISQESDLNGSTQWLQCAHSVPCGIAADAALKSDGVVTSSPVSLESSDANALAKLLAGSVDAALVFKTDVIANPSKLRAIPFKDTQAASSQYQIAISNQKSTVKNHWAHTFLSYLTGFQAKKFLAANGFVVNK
jgi:molybdate transport system substrate-binding protein